MTARLTLDSAGRVVIPKRLRDELDLRPGDELDLEAAGEQITLRPVRHVPPLAKEKGVWVFRTGEPLPTSTADNTLRAIREERDRGQPRVASVKAFFDTSALVPFFYGDHPHHEPSHGTFLKFTREDGCCGAHSLAELYSTLTRMPGKHRVTGDQALLFVGDVAERLETLGCKNFAAYRSNVGEVL